MRKNKGGRPKKIRDSNENEKIQKVKREKLVEGEESKVEKNKESDKSSNQEIQKSNDDITPDDFEIEKPEIAKIVNLEIENLFI